MLSKPLVSVLVNNYNKEKYCIEAVNSVLKQIYNNIEIIFYDDCSSDNSLKLIDKYKKKNHIKNLKIIKNLNHGNIASFNQIRGIKTALKKSKGSIICFLDSDDFFKKDKIKKVVNFFSQNKKQNILFDKPSFYFNNKKNIKSESLYLSRNSKWPKFPPTSCMSFRRHNLLKVIQLVSIKKYNHLWLDFRLATFFSIRLNQFNLIEEHLTFYRQSEFSHDKRYKKYLNLMWWSRRKQAFDFLFYIKKGLRKKTMFSIDYMITKYINKLNSFYCKTFHKDNSHKNHEQS